MSNKKKEVKEEILREGDFYKNNIIDMVNSLNDAWILKTIHNFFVGMTKEGN